MFTLVALTRGLGRAVYTRAALLVLVPLELWVDTLQTLALVSLAAVIATAIGMPIGVLAARHRAVCVTARSVLHFY